MGGYELTVTVSEEDAANLWKVASHRGLSETDALRWSITVAAYVAERIASGRTLLVRELDGSMTRPSFEVSTRGELGSPAVKKG